MEENGLRIDGDELYSECTVFLTVAEELIKTCIDRPEVGKLFSKDRASN
jgi:hypothetical protein